jgi:hypothetical protein
VSGDSVARRVHLRDPFRTNPRCTRTRSLCTSGERQGAETLRDVSASKRRDTGLRHSSVRMVSAMPSRLKARNSSPPTETPTYGVGGIAERAHLDPMSPLRRAVNRGEPTKGRVKRTLHIGVRVADLERIRAFYTGLGVCSPPDASGAAVPVQDPNPLGRRTGRAWQRCRG